jgi:uncharacterized protein (TIGR03437 family)
MPAFAQTHMVTTVGDLPVAFEPNVGQTDPQVRFLARTPGTIVFLTDSEAVMVLDRREKGGSGQLRRRKAPVNWQQEVVRMKLVGSETPQASGLEKLPGVSNYFIGQDPKKWRTDIPHYARIEYRGVYPGIDMMCYGKGRQLEYDLVVAPGANPRQIELAWEGVERLDVNADGDLVLATRLGEIIEKRPRVYQEIAGRRVEVAANYLLRPHNRVAFELARYDRGSPLVIDPVMLVYSSYLGGNGEDGADSIAVDSQGAAYFGGWTSSANFPTQSPYQAANGGGDYDAFVTKISAAGNTLLYSTYLGGNGTDSLQEIAVDSAFSAYVTGHTDSTNFPTQAAYQSTLRGSQAAFVTKLSPAGNALIYSTYLSGSGEDQGDCITADAAGYAYVSGYTTSPNFPTTQPAYQSTLKGSQAGFVARFDPKGPLVYSTYLSGSGQEDALVIATDGTGYAYVSGYTTSPDFPTTQGAYQSTLKGGEDLFVAKVAPTGNALAYSTFLGGSLDEEAWAMAVDGSGAAYVTGFTYSTDYPTRSPYQATNRGGPSGNAADAMVSKLSPSGNALVFSTYLGGSGDDLGNGIAVDTAGAIYVVGHTGSNDFPVQSAYQSVNRGGLDAFVTKLLPAGNALVYSTYLGGSGDDSATYLAIDAVGAAYIPGWTTSTNFPTSSPYQSTNRGGPTYGEDAFVTKLQLPTTVATNPPGLAVVVDGVNLTSPQAFDWAPGTSHTISAASPQGSGGTRYGFTNWSDGGGQTHFIVASSSLATYIANLALVTTFPQVNAGGIVNNASYNLQSSSVAPGSIAALFGTNLTNGTSCVQPSCNPAFGSDGKLGTTMAGAQVTVNGTPVPIFYATPGQLGIQIPFEAVGASATVSVSVAGQASTPATVTLALVAPGIFTASQDGKGAGAITHVDGSLVTTQNPAHTGELVILYATGLGQVTPAVATGALPAGASNTVAPVTVSIGGINVIPLDFAGLAGCCVGLNQINARVPLGVSSGNAVPVVLYIGGQSSNTATIAVQ